MRRWIALGVLAVAVVVAAGCGGDDTTATSSTTEWAGGVCTALGTWKTPLPVQGVAAGRQPLRGRAEGRRRRRRGGHPHARRRPERTRTPRHASGAGAQDTITTLADDLAGEADTIASAVDNASGVGEVLQAASTVSSTLVTMGQQVGSAVSQLEGLDEAQELKDAFAEADSCSGLSGS